MRKVKIGLIVVVLVLLLIVVVQNSAAVEVRLLWFTPFQLSLVLLELFTFLLGGLVGFLAYSLLRRRRHQRQQDVRPPAVGNDRGEGGS